jgi:hypothetical protein
MNPIPSDPMRAHARMINAFCEDLLDRCLNGGQGTPRTDAVCEINRQMRDTREAGEPNKQPASNS